MKIEDRLDRVELVLQALHGKIGHKWRRGDSNWKKCPCGASQFAHDPDEWAALPHSWETDDEL